MANDRVRAVIKLEVPDWQIGQDATVYFPDTMLKHAKCEKDTLVHCAECRFANVSPTGIIKCNGIFRMKDWYCADGKEREE